MQGFKDGQTGRLTAHLEVGSSGESSANRISTGELVLRDIIENAIIG